MLWMSAFRRYGPIERDFLSAKTYARQAIEDRGGSAYGCKSGEIEGILVPWLTLGFRKIRKGRSRGGVFRVYIKPHIRDRELRCGLRPTGIYAPAGIVDMVFRTLWQPGRFGWGSGLFLLYSQMLEDLFDEVLVLDEGNDAHRLVAPWAGEEVHFIDLLYQPCPVLVVRFG